MRKKGHSSIASLHISDFGTAKKMAEVSQLQGKIGTLKYMAPEVESGDLFDAFQADSETLNVKTHWQCGPWD